MNIVVFSEVEGKSQMVATVTHKKNIAAANVCVLVLNEKKAK